MSDCIVTPGDEAVPIEALLHDLATSDPLPRAALVACVSRIAESAPPLRELLHRAAAGEELDEDNALLFFRGLHVLGAARDSESCAPLLRLLRLPDDALDFLLGDAVGETLPRIICGVFDGNATALIDLASDPDRDTHMRWSVWRALTYLTWAGQVPRAAMVAALERFDDQRLAPDGDALWSAWEESIAMLGLAELAPRVERVWAEGRMDEDISGPEYFAKALARTQRKEDDPARFIEDRLGPIDDIGTVLDWTDRNESDDDEAFDAEAMQRALELKIQRGLAATEPWAQPLSSPASLPVHNPYRHVGRNDPCPCGSGKKYKRCCLPA